MKANKLDKYQYYLKYDYEKSELNRSLNLGKKRIYTRYPCILNGNPSQTEVAAILGKDVANQD